MKALGKVSHKFGPIFRDQDTGCMCFLLLLFTQSFMEATSANDVVVMSLAVMWGKGTALSAWDTSAISRGCIRSSDLWCGGAHDVIGDQFQECYKSDRFR